MAEILPTFDDQLVISEPESVIVDVSLASNHKEQEGMLVGNQLSVVSDPLSVASNQHTTSANDDVKLFEAGDGNDSDIIVEVSAASNHKRQLPILVGEKTVP